MSKFDDIIKQKANEHVAPVPQDAWDNIMKEKKKKRFVFFWWFIGILLCGLSIVGAYTYNSYKNNKNIAATSKKTSPLATINNKNIVSPDKSTSLKEEPISSYDNNAKTITTTDEINTVAPGNEEGKEKQQDTKNIPPGKEKIIPVENKQRIKPVENTTGTTITKETVIQKNNDTGKHRTKRSIPVNSSIKETALNNKASIKEDDESIAGKKKIQVKEKGKSRLNVRAGETDIAEEKQTTKKDEPATIETTDEKTASIDQQASTDNLKEDLKNTTVQSPVKKDLAVDSVASKQLHTPPVENKKAQANINKPAKKHSWFIDLGVAPVLPIQQYDKTTTFTRTLQSGNDLSVFSGKLVNTKIDPSVAFSLSARRELNKRTSIGIGLQYLQLKEEVSISGTEINTKYTVVDRLINGIGGPQLINDTIKVVTQGDRKITATNSYVFFTIPVFVQHDLIQKHSWSLSAVGGVYINLYGKYKNAINENSTAQLTASSQTKNQNSSVGFALYGGFRVAKKITNRWDLFATPSVTWALGRQNIKNSLLDKKIQQAGLNIGLSYKLN